MVGDPLYRPCGRDFDKLQDDLQRRRSPMLAWCYLRLVDLNLATGKPVPQCLQTLEPAVELTHSAVLAEKVADLYAAQGKPSSAAYEYSRALKFDPSPLQRVRLRLTLAEKLIELGRDTEAYDTYVALLEDQPHYPDKIMVHRKLFELAEKLKKPDAAKWQAATNAGAMTGGAAQGKR